MNKSIIILVVAVWILCTMYVTLGGFYGFPYRHQAMIGSWVASGLLLVSIIIYVRKFKSK